MTTDAQATHENGKAGRGRWIAWLLVPAIFLIFVGANAHFIYVAFQSEPGCVAHSKAKGEAGRYSAARSAC